jgi:hypothetical protein
MYWMVGRFAGVILIFCMTGCAAPSEPITTAFQCRVTFRDATSGFRLGLRVIPGEQSLQQGRLFVERASSDPPHLYYHENLVVRSRLADTVVLEADAFEDWLDDLFAALEEVRESRTGQAGRMSIRVEVTDSAMKKGFSAFADAPEEPVVGRFCDRSLALFEQGFPKVDWQALDADVAVRMDKRVDAREDSLRIEVVKRGADIRVAHSRRPFVRRLNEEEYVDLWRVLEANSVWRLPGDGTYRSSYPLRYEMSLRLGTRSASWRVYAPSLVQDRRYFNILSYLENLLTWEGRW